MADNGRPSLKKLSKRVLRKTIQKGVHDSEEDAKATMDLVKKKRYGRSFRMFKIRYTGEEPQKIKLANDPQRYLAGRYALIDGVKSFQNNYINNW
ncbi:hypothetical protein BN7_215 [Wickerhamomyces ciferrii]|uniref:Uncharacterized protein n=1 Tax=Wickerhamomyces ciferrii (strain ATCC 14091 / BCRC 22168 / CBS 111 / JCM 3599 / NBRC 0793 / NRRL Y-1031 F-60-10) TaxID=1206466 RepID=K0KCR4_WICCF|nr:uncharacterized protein BN7_215 [Wickerhamomyces ciferrii]CCH40681.1 hypothetical protein BN7_215 [Wickerhamomyces ciferrii]